ncbi:MAG: hypothetical protein RSC00_04845 [Ruthenibacterium sp.]
MVVFGVCRACRHTRQTAQPGKKPVGVFYHANSAFTAMGQNKALPLSSSLLVAVSYQKYYPFNLS